PLNIQSHLAWIRTRLSIVTTLESWARTSISLIAFGFAIVQFFEHFNKMENVKLAIYPGLSRWMGLTMIAVGTLGLALAIWQYVLLVKYLESEPFRDIAGVKKVPRIPVLLVVATALCLVGMAVFLALLFRLT